MNILIVDDQPSVIASLTSTIDWRAAGIDRVYSASSTILAKNILQTEKIDILLTDIEMPVENGLELIRWVRNQKCDIECILLTSHADFDYAKQGIELGVMDYVIQPASNASIVASVKKVADKISFQDNSARMYSAGEFSNYEINHASRHFFKTWPDPKDDENFEALLTEKIRRLNELGCPCQEEDSCIFFLTVIREWYALPLSELSCRSRYAEVMRSVFSFANGYTTTYSEDDSHFFTMLFMPSYDDITDYFEILIKQVKESLSCSIDIFYCHTGFRELRAAVRYVTAMDYLGYQNSTVTKLYPTAEHRNFDAASQNYRDYYQQIKQYIRDNVSMQITRQAISDHIHISPDYISHIVRTIAECSCKELIAREKMQYARTLIQTTSKSIGDIAVECGFDSFAYFSKVYKSIYGISPKSTRK